MKRNIVISATLFVVCALAALILSAVNNWTKPIIEKNEQKSIEKALGKMFSGFSSYDTEEITYDAGLNASIKKIYSLHFDESEDKYVFYVEATNFYGETKVMLGIDEDDIIRKVEYISLVQTNDLNKIQSFIGNEYTDKAATIDSIVSDETVSKVYAGATVGSTMMNSVVKTVILYLEEGVK